MKARFLLAAAAFACSAFAAKAFDTYEQAVRAARAADAANKYDEAVKHFAEAESLAKNPWQKFGAQYDSSLVLFKKDDLKGAIGILDKILADKKYNESQKAYAMARKGSLLKWKGMDAEATKVLQKAMKYKVKGVARQCVLNSYADLVRRAKAYDEAAKCYREALAEKKGDAYQTQTAKLGLARIAADKKQFDKALELYLEVTQLPDLSPILEQAAYSQIIELIYLPRKKFAEIAGLLDKLEARNSLSRDMVSLVGSSRIRMNLVQAEDLLKQKKFDEALEKIKAVEAIPTNNSWLKQKRVSSMSDIEIARGNYLKQQKKYDEAIEAFKKAGEFKGTTDYYKYYSMLAIAEILLAQKKLEEAKEYIDKSMVSSSPDHKSRSMYNLANYLIEKKNFDEALSVAEKAAAIEGQNPNWKALAYGKTAEIYFRHKNDLVKADEYIRKSMAVPNATWGKNEWLLKQIQKKIAEQK